MVDQLFITFDYEHVKRIYIHDPNFFIQNNNPIGLPSSIYIGQIDPNKSANHYHRLALTVRVTEVQELNVAEDPCEESQHYSFQVSLKATFENPRGSIPHTAPQHDVSTQRTLLMGQFFHTARGFSTFAQTIKTMRSSLPRIRKIPSHTAP